MGNRSRVVLDSNCLSYLVDALNAGSPPDTADLLGVQKLALARIMFYDEWGLYVTPGVTDECARIRNVGRAELHTSWLDSIFTEVQPRNSSAILSRTAQLLTYHNDSDDCRILAESEDASARVLLTYDDKFISRLSAQTNVRLMRAADYWIGLNIPKGAQPETTPHAKNPLSSARWWRWE